MAAKPLPSPEVLRQLLSYDPETGVLTWRERPASHFKTERAEREAKRWNGRHAGRIAGSVHWTGYRHIKIGAADYPAHRIAWVIAHGQEPSAFIDHINGQRDDNRLANLREATRTENNRNASSSGSSKYRGVCKPKNKQKWCARYKVSGKYIHIGYFETEEDAALAYDRAVAPIYKDFARMNFPNRKNP